MAGFLERRLSSEQRAELTAHIECCASCRRLVIEVSSGVQLLSIVAETHTTHPIRAQAHGDTLARGTIVGRFVVLDLLGRGGMGVVYMAYDPELDRKVALKLLHPDPRNAGDPRTQLLAEAKVMARISHANVIAIYDVGNYRDQVFAAMELVEGTTLRRWMAERRNRTWRESVDVLLLAGEGLAAAHAANVVHRDFKPENVLIGRDGRVKVSDFGLAAPPCPARGPVAGTPGYLPVEALQTGVIDERGDQFSFCIALHEALHGYRPFSAQTFDEFVAEVRRGPAPAGRRRPGPARLSRVIRRGLALAPDHRYPSMRELLADTRRAVAAYRRRRFVAAAISALVLSLGAIAVVVDTRSPIPRRSCADAEAKLASVWDTARRDAIRSAFLRTGLGSAPTAFDRAVMAVDRYATVWAVSGDPDVAIYGWRDRLQVAARNQDGFLVLWCTGPNGAWSHPMQQGTERIVGTPALFSHYDALYVIVHGEDRSLWSWHVDRRDWWTRWQIRGAVSDDPNVGIDPRSELVNVVARGLDNRLYRWQSNNPDLVASFASDGWQDPEIIDDTHRVTGTAATIIYHGAMHVFARGLDNAVYHWWKDETWHREDTGGAYTDSPDVFHFGNQLHTSGRGVDGILYTVWYDPASGFWNVENGEVPVSD